MNRDDIIRMAVECQLVTTSNRDGVYMAALERFAELVAAAEREACAKVCEETTAAWTQQVYNGACMDCAAAIRSRGEP